MSSIWTIRRSATDIKLTGLCGGVARYWGVDPLLVRVGCVLLALSGGIGVVLYLAGWLLVPVDGTSKAQIDDLIGRQARSWPREVWIAIITACCVIAFVVLSMIAPFNFWPAAILAVVWYFGYYKNRPSRPTSSEVTPPVEAPQQSAAPRFFDYPGPPTPFTEAANAWRRRVEDAQRSSVEDAQQMGVGEAQRTGDSAAPSSDTRAASSTRVWGHETTVPRVHEDVSEPVGPAASLPPAQPLGPESAAYNAFLASPDPAGLYTEPADGTLSPAPAPQRPGARTSARRLRLVSVAVLGLTLSGLGYLDTHGVPIPVGGYFAAALLVLGLTLVAAAWFGRARGILGLALLLLLATLGTTVSGPVVEQQGWGAQQRVYTTAAQLVPGDTQDTGQLKVDLTGLTSTTDATYTAQMDVGSLEVSAPTTMNVVVKSQVDAGGVVISGQEARYGNELDSTVAVGPTDPKKRTLTLNLSVDAGMVKVSR